MKSSVATGFLWILFGPFGLFTLAWGFSYLARGEYLSAIVALGFATFALGLVVMLAVIASRRVTPRVTCEDGGTTVRPDRRVDVLLMASTFGAFFAMAVYALFAPLDMIVIRVPRGDERYFVITCAAAVLVGVLSLWQIVRRRGTSYLRLTVDGLETGNTVSTARRGWDEVTEVTGRPQTARQSGGTTYIMTADGRTRVLPSDWYTPGGHALREFVRHYWQHPEDRDELADDRAADRLRVGS